MSVIIIPTYNPTNKLIELVESIKLHSFNNIIVVNDGSTNNAENIFNEISTYVTLLVHEKKLGKGYAIKTALEYLKQNKIEDKILIMYGDGRYDIEDGIKLLEQIDNQEKKLILGIKKSKKRNPLKTKKEKIIDIQTGLRAFNYNMMEDFLYIKSKRFETNMLMYCIKNNIPIKETEINTNFKKKKCSIFKELSNFFKIFNTSFLLKNKKLIFMVLIDIISIAIYVSSFYFIKYRIPRALSTENISFINNNKNMRFKFNEDVFSDELIIDELEYKSKDISITIAERRETISNRYVNYYIVDIYLANIECLKTGFANDTYGKGYLDTVESMANQFNAVLAVNGDYYSYTDDGLVIRNGKVYRTFNTKRDTCIIYYDGKMKTFSGSELDIDKEIENGAYQAWSFGPALLNNGESMEQFNTGSDAFLNYNPRTSIGYFEPGHYCIIVADGRSDESKGIKMKDLSKIYENLGCQYAYNLDGGYSSALVYDNKIINTPRINENGENKTGERKVSDIVYIQEVQ